MAQRGSFNTIRLVAALVVFHSHMYAISGRAEPIMPGGLKLGAVSVGVFFVVSGYLVAQSALHRPIAEYFAARFLRVLPGLAVCTIVSIVLGAFVTTLSTSAYVSSPETWSYLCNIAVFWTEMQARLPGVFAAQPIDHVNGSLWTLRYEILCYVALGFAALFGRGGIIAAAIGMTLLLAVSPLLRPELVFRLLDTFELRHVLRLGSAFALGAALSFADIRGTAWATLGLAVIALGSANFSSFEAILFSFLYGCIAVLIGRALHLDRRLTGCQDISYGVYIYAFPFQQASVAVFGPSMFGMLYVTSLAATLLAAISSWVWIERPLLHRKEAALRWISTFIYGSPTRADVVQVVPKHSSGG